MIDRRAKAAFPRELAFGLFALLGPV